MTDAIGDREVTGAAEIAALHMEGVSPGDWDMQGASEVVQSGDFSALAFTSTYASGITVFQFDDDLQIVHEWVMGH